MSALSALNMEAPFSPSQKSSIASKEKQAKIYRVLEDALKMDIIGSVASVSLDEEPNSSIDGLNHRELSNHIAQWVFSRNLDIKNLSIRSKSDQIGDQEISRSAFFESAALWYRGDNGGSHPEIWVTAENGLRHPQRKFLPEGELYRRHIHSLDLDISLRLLNIDSDLDIFTEWMNQPRVAEFWEQAWPKSQQREYLQKTLADPHKQPVIACFGNQPFAYFEVYWAMEDRLGPYYNAKPYDRGVHLLVGDKRFLGTKYFYAWMHSISHFMFLDEPRTQCLVGEPRYDNKALLRYIPKLPGWTLDKEFDFPHKRARLLLCDRTRFFAEAKLG